uniref:Protein kinase domain-containing protein n=1 Tax=Phytophthora ramorum TaxID=164328 RepID=H3GU94_PHYRM
MSSVVCPRACPSTPTLLSGCSASDVSLSSSSVFLASASRRKRRLRPEMDAESCSDVTEVDPASLSGLGIQAAALGNSTLTVLNLTGNSVHDVQDLQLPEDLEQLYLSKNELTSLKVPESWRHLELLDVSFTTIEKWANFTPPTDLSKLDFSGNSINTIRGVRFPPNLRTLFLNGSSVTEFEVCKSDLAVLERLEAFNVTSLAVEEGSCSDGATQKAVLIANASYSLCVLTDEAFDKEYKRGKISSSTSLTTLLVLFFSLASAIFVLLMLFIIKRKVIDERRTKAALAEKVKAEQAANESSSDDDDSDKMKMTSAILTDDVRGDPDFERYLAVKQVAPEKSKSVRELQRFTREIRLYAILKHPKIVAFRGIAWSSLADLSLVIEYMPNGDLAQFLERQQMLDSQRRGWSWTADEDSTFTHSKLMVALDVADALVYLHSFAEPIMHRDLKAQNILLSNKWVAKISDFGVSKGRKQRDGQKGVSTGGPQTAEVGTAAWIAPEVIKGGRYDQKADIYSFGVVMCELDTCTRPYALGVASSNSASGMTSFVSSSSAKDDEEVKSLLSSNATLALAVSEKRVMPAFHSDCPRAILDLARTCLSYDPDDRPSAKELWRSLQDLASPGALLTTSRKATLTESIRHVSTSA